jgi:hypothetical protein
MMARAAPELTGPTMAKTVAGDEPGDIFVIGRIQIKNDLLRRAFMRLLSRGHIPSGVGPAGTQQEKALMKIVRVGYRKTCRPVS